MAQQLTLHHTEQGAGLPLVLLHGFPLDSRMWREQVEGLAQQCRVITPDLQGFGRSRSEEAFSIDSQADAVHALLKQIGALPCVLGGLSMGGYVALAYAQKCPGQLKGLILVDTKAAGDTPEGKQGRVKMIELVRKCGSSAVADEMMPKMLTDNTIVTRPQTVELLRQMMESCPAKTIEQALLAMRDRPDRMELLPSIADPTLILVGQNDAITPVEAAEAMKERLAHATLRVIPDAGHLSPMENPGAVNEAIAGFVGGLGG